MYTFIDNAGTQHVGCNTDTIVSFLGVRAELYSVEHTYVLHEDKCPEGHRPRPISYTFKLTALHFPNIYIK